MENHPLRALLRIAVPRYIENLRASGGPTADDFAHAQESGARLAAKGDILLFGSNRVGETADLFNRVAQSIAVLAFVPGGVTLFNTHWNANSATAPHA
jgi:hypothetical protein